MLGRIGCMLPLFMNKRPGSWFAVSVCIERMTQMSSISAAVCGNRSVTSMPAWPCLRCLYGEGRIFPSRRLRPLAFTKLGHALAGVFVQRRLGVERVDVRRPAVHEQEDEVLGPRREVRRLGRERVAVIGQRWRGGEQAGVAQHGGEADGAEPAADAGEDVAAGDGALIAHSVVNQLVLNHDGTTGRIDQAR